MRLDNFIDIYKIKKPDHIKIDETERASYLAGNGGRYIK